MGTRPVRLAVAVTSYHRALLGAGFVTFALFAEHHSRVPAAGYVAAVAITGTGSVLGALTARAAASISPARLAGAAYAVASVAMVAAGLVLRSPAVAAALATSSFCFQNLRLVADATVQSVTAESALRRCSPRATCSTTSHSSAAA
jgi:hypothetical protein